MFCDIVSAEELMTPNCSDEARDVEPT